MANGGIWFDAGGFDGNGGDLPTCDWYQSYSDRCQDTGNKDENGGMVACEACCVCGGGSTGKIGNGNNG
eukprot:CAMPEP_0170872202 /NCGR_PEP_ID=MMETSP0734-20130129/26430_1 /TAXON_ID=186038 /ORGANISM="Fragilariopsis kerguelensis, Strain L26-C5" /LENGTH=68 /DNA_ID=CAMNT_0011251951 /DNA_START=229 /DNA_END=435 /DNA_ORIENTATION=-